MVPLANFFVFIGLQWWAFWYPGAEPGGGGYIAQRIFSARDEKQGLLSVLWFNIAHYAIRPWPWILTGVAVIVLYPGLAHPETGYMMVLNNYLPHQYARHRHRRIPRRLHVHHRHPVELGRVVPGLGFLPPLRQPRAPPKVTTCWSRGCAPSCWSSSRRTSRCSSAPSPPAGRSCCKSAPAPARSTSCAGTGGASTPGARSRPWPARWPISLVLSRWHPFSGNSSLVFAKGAIVTTLVTTIVWVTVTLLTKPEPQRSADRASIATSVPMCAAGSAIADMVPDVPQNRDLGRNLWAWALGCAMVYLCLFGTGKILLHESGLGAILLFFSAMCAGMLYRGVVRNFADETEDAPGTVPDWVETPAASGH